MPMNRWITVEIGQVWVVVDTNTPEQAPNGIKFIVGKPVYDWPADVWEIIFLDGDIDTHSGTWINLHCRPAT
jgi:hypothetical protein